MTQDARMTWTGDRLWTQRGERIAGEGLHKALEHTLGSRTGMCRSKKAPWSAPAA